MNLVDIKDNLHDESILAILAHSQHMPTQEKLNRLADRYESDPDIFAFACYDDCFVCGTIILRHIGSGQFEIASIATAPVHRKQGIGSKLISFAANTLKCGVI